jgi:hypothetical protein
MDLVLPVLLDLVLPVLLVLAVLLVLFVLSVLGQEIASLRFRDPALGVAAADHLHTSPQLEHSGVLQGDAPTALTRTSAGQGGVPQSR